MEHVKVHARLACRTDIGYKGVRERKCVVLPTLALASAGHSATGTWCLSANILGAACTISLRAGHLAS
eukprot:557176-Pelagomonas_calceolata.AAC.10